MAGTSDSERYQKYLTLVEELTDRVKEALYKHRPLASPHEGWAVIREEADELWDEVKENRGRELSARNEAIQIAVAAIRYALEIPVSKDGKLHGRE